MSGSPDVVVVGAGIVGAACAYALARDGRRVEVLESRFAGGGSTAAAMGHLVVMDDSPAQLALTVFSRALWTALAPELPAWCEDDPCGTLWVAADDEEMAHVHAKARVYAAGGVETRVLGPLETAAAEPRLRRGLAGALLVPGDRVLYPPNAARFLLERARALGATLREGWPVEAIGPGFASGPKGRVDAGAVVNAAGPDAPRLTAGLPIQPRRGHLVITDRYPGFLRHQVVELGYLKSAHGADRESVAFNVQPRATGQILIGSSREFVGLAPGVNHALCERMLRRALAYMPDLARLSTIRTWTGFRPATPDSLPFIGPAEDGVLVAAGHEGLGITTALGTAALLADHLAGRTPAIDPQPYLPTRKAAPHV